MARFAPTGVAGAARGHHCLPDNLIDYLPSLLNQAIQDYSCFIRYSAKVCIRER
jgi:hypothetical protein